MSDGAVPASLVVAVVAAALQAHTIQRAPIRSYPTTFRCTGSDCNWSVQAEDGEEQGRAHQAAVVVEAQREAVTITTVEQLDALPDDSAVLVDDTPARKHLGDWYFANDDGDGYGSRSLALYLPVLLVWHPGWVAVDGITPKCWCGHSDDEHATDECACTCAPAVGGEQR